VTGQGQTEDLAPYFARVDYAYYVVTVQADDGAPSGCLAGFVTQCSIDPPNFLVCISKVNHTYTIAQGSTAMEGVVLGHFSVGDHEAFLLRGSRAVDGGHPGLLTYRSSPPMKPGHPVSG
jgi:hypothetical protein